MTPDVALVRAALLDGGRLHQLVAETHAEAIARCGVLIRAALQAGGKVLLCGNGGSAADAQHVAAEFVGRFVIERRGLPAIALTTDTSALTAIGNDYGYDAVFSRQVEALGRPGDVLVAITTSGKSPNVLRAIDAARALGMQVIAWTGAKGADLVARCDAGIAVPATETARVQEIHASVGHAVCAIVDADPSALPLPGAGAQRKVLDRAAMVARREVYRAAGRTVAWTNGVFDVLHAGHLHSLRAARALGDVLFVGINADAAVTQAKGPTRPIFPAAERAEMLAALELVDAVVIFDEPTPAEVLAAVRPDVHVKGADYAPPHGKPVPEADLVRGWGGRVEFVPLVPERSSTDTLARLLRDP